MSFSNPQCGELLVMYKRFFRTGVTAVILASLFSVNIVSPAVADGITWTSRTSPLSGSPLADSTWTSVAYGDGLFVAVGDGGTNRVMRSTDGITWTTVNVPAVSWRSVTYGNGLFVAVTSTSTTFQVMTSPDGLTWTGRSAAVNNQWRSVTFGNSLFVAVSVSGTGNRVMTSTDGTTWTSRTSAADNGWYSVGYGDGLFVAVSITGTGNRVMTSGETSTTAAARVAAANAEAARVAAANAEAARVAAAQAEAARKAREQQELINILALIPKIGELTLSLGETTKSLYSTKCVKGKTTKYVKYGAKCPRGFARK